MTTWLLIIFLGNPNPHEKFIEFATKETCIAAMNTINEKGSGKAVCVEGGKPVHETQGATGK